MAIKQFLEAAEEKFTAVTTAARGITMAKVLGLLTESERNAYRRDVQRMVAVAELQRLEGFTILQEVAAELLADKTSELIGMSPGKFRGPHGIELKGGTKTLREHGPQALVDLVIERGATAQRKLNFDDRLRVAFRQSNRTQRV